MNQLKTKIWKILRNKFHELSFLLKGRRYQYAQSFLSERSFPNAWSICTTSIKIRPDYGETNSNRVANMQLAANKLTNLIIYPNEVFRFWRLIPYPSKENGFLVGPVILNGKLANDYGGGLCQVSSTLYGAFLRAGLEIIERHAHSVDIHGEERTVPLGKDAAVAFGYKDLIVKNNHSVALQLKAECDTSSLEFRVHLLGMTPPYSIL